jgi:predicted nucleotidyltransferase component of viral defense system
LSLFRDSSEFGPTIGAAAERLGISPTAVEKDYWVSQILRALVHDFAEDFIFKGGTSLSKGYGILERFSDDVDILILQRGRGKGATDKLMKSMGEVAATATGGQAERHLHSETGVHRAYRVTYPTAHRPTDAVATSVLLEMGVRGGPNPHEQVPIDSLLGNVLEAAGTTLSHYDDLKPLKVAVLHPGRTLLEKLYGIHGMARQVAANALSAEKLRRNGRPFYDVYQLLGHVRVLELLADRAQAEQIMASIEATSQEAFNATGELRPEGGFAASMAFDGNSDVSRQMQGAYEVIMPALYFGAEPLPTWHAICTRVHEQHHLL